MQSCKSTKTEYSYDVPDVVFPTFPDPLPYVSFDKETGSIVMPLEYYIRIAEYKRDVDKIESQLERIREMYKSQEGEK